jgi:TetR/AcrR family transcriptional repressor of lmrAB and yxaGH operons
MPRQTDSRERMVATTGRLLRRQGFAATGWRQVVAESGAPWGSQAHHFPGGKEQLAAEALEREAAQVQRDLEALLRERHPADAIAAWTEAAAGQLVESGWAEGCPIATTALEMASTSDRLAVVCRHAFDGWQEVLTRAMSARGVHADEARALGVLVVAATEGALLLAKSARDARPLDEVGAQLAVLLRERVP